MTRPQGPHSIPRPQYGDFHFTVVYVVVCTNNFFLASAFSLNCIGLSFHRFHRFSIKMTAPYPTQNMPYIPSQTQYPPAGYQQQSAAPNDVTLNLQSQVEIHISCRYAEAAYFLEPGSLNATIFEQIYLCSLAFKILVFLSSFWVEFSNNFGVVISSCHSLFSM